MGTVGRGRGPGRGGGPDTQGQGPPGGFGPRDRETPAVDRARGCNLRGQQGPGKGPQDVRKLLGFLEGLAETHPLVNFAWSLNCSGKINILDRGFGKLFPP